jgi:hypothetical protein
MNNSWRRVHKCSSQTTFHSIVSGWLRARRNWGNPITTNQVTSFNNLITSVFTLLFTIELDLDQKITELGITTLAIDYNNAAILNIMG